MGIDDITCSLADGVNPFAIDIELVVGSHVYYPHFRFGCYLSADAIFYSTADASKPRARCGLSGSRGAPTPCRTKSAGRRSIFFYPHVY